MTLKWTEMGRYLIRSRSRILPQIGLKKQLIVYFVKEDRLHPIPARFKARTNCTQSKARSIVFPRSQIHVFRLPGIKKKKFFD